MQEYIIYAIFIFFPIGALMDFLLRRQGLIPKYRLVIITASLAIIISFPILMGTLGLPIAFILYASAIVALTCFFIKATQSHAWHLRQQGVSANDEVYVSDRFIDMTKIQTVGDLEDAIWPKESENSVIAAIMDSSHPDVSINENRVVQTELLQDDDSSLEADDKLRANELPSSEINFIQAIKQPDMEQEIEAEDTGNTISPASDQEEFPKVLVDPKEEPPVEEDIIMAASHIGDELEAPSPNDADEAIEAEDTSNTINPASDQEELPAVLVDSKEEPPVKEDIIMAASHIGDELEVLSPNDADEEINNIEAQADSLSGTQTETMEALETSSFEAKMELNEATVPVPEKEIAAILDSGTIIDDLSAEPGLELDIGPGSEDESSPTVTELLVTASLNEIVDLDSEGVLENDHQAENQIAEIVLEAPDNTGDTNLNGENDRINQLIDQGFGLKNDQRVMEALSYFAEALDISTDEDLSYLLLMEMVNLYKDMGMYAQAEELLFLSIGKAHRRTDIIYEIERQLSYIRLLSLELDRLGLANTPISEVPRLVRMNVAEIVEV